MYLEDMIFSFFIIGIVMVLGTIWIIKEELNAKKRRKEWERKIRHSGIYEVDRMKGSEFEVFLKFLLESHGYQAQVTKTSGDYGADLVLRSPGKTIVVQAKRYSKKVGLKAVQEIVSAKSYYKADECWVITNNYFTAPAMKLGNSNEVLLIDRDELIEWMLEEKEEEGIAK
ncbi:restriction endonuclease [Peribacillus simplex]|uniref:Restriction endonuclease n=2 Tax=Peribacillus TaxID=2675229 RepID=A0AA90SW23_9BACI|nr:MULTISPECIES: restriction endonuclease [Peribacillus]MDP1418567.1 restriction endonuclease [Peribacillus simplex]MDP1451455.1 restriction endonuclease [Peribacillus frigoritolerans]